MPYSIKHHSDLVEVELWGDTSIGEVLAAVNELHVAYPNKERPDLWNLSREILLPLSTFPLIAKAIGGLCGGSQVYRRSAIVTSGSFQHAMADLYKLEAAQLPFQVGIFSSRDEALKWLREEAAAPSAGKA